MSWELKWEGRATDFMPELLAASGKPGATAQLAKDALWEAVQRAGERNAHAWVKASAQGWEEKDEPGSGRLAIILEVSANSPDEISQRIREQQPVDLLRGQRLDPQVGGAQ